MVNGTGAQEIKNQEIKNGKRVTGMMPLAVGDRNDAPRRITHLPEHP
jgi:hypothetical protein